MLSLIIKQIREYFRSPANVFMGLLFPVLLVFFLGTMLQNLDIADYDIGEIKLQYSVTQTDEQSGKAFAEFLDNISMISCLLYTSPSPRDRTRSRMPSSA